MLSRLSAPTKLPACRFCRRNRSLESICPTLAEPAAPMAPPIALPPVVPRPIVRWPAVTPCPNAREPKEPDEPTEPEEPKEPEDPVVRLLPIELDPVVPPMLICAAAGPAIHRPNAPHSETPAITRHRQDCQMLGFISRTSL